jgi:hypothetical protein
VKETLTSELYGDLARGVANAFEVGCLSTDVALGVPQISDFPNYRLTAW